MKIALIGYGKMGKEIERLALERGDEIVGKIDSKSPPPSAETAGKADVAIHNATPSSVVGHVRQWSEWGKPLVIGTTGWYHELPEVRAIAKNNNSGVVYASNFSIGVNIMFVLVNHAGKILDKLPEYDAFIHEVHHKEKLDSPSGTALTLADLLIRQLHRKKEILAKNPEGKIRPDQLAVASTRGGNVVGTHRVTLDSGADSIEITHTAKNRSGFALGALLAAAWIRGKSGVFTMEDVLADFLKTGE